MAFLSDKQKKEMLQGLELFENVQEEDLARLAPWCRVVELSKAQPVFHKHDEGRSMYVVVNGRVKITSHSTVDDQDREIVFNIMNPGEVFGEIAFLDGEERTADATALEKCDLLELERRNFLPLLRRDPHMAIGLMNVLCRRIRYSTDHIEDVAFLELEARLAKKLIAFAEYFSESDEDGIKLDLSINQSELGAMVDATREAVNRQLGKWRSDGILKLARGTIVITNLERLEDIADQME